MQGGKLEAIAEAYGVKVVEGVLSHQMKRFVIDGNKVRSSNRLAIARPCARSFLKLTDEHACGIRRQAACVTCS